MARTGAALDPATFTTFGALLRYLLLRQHLTQFDLALATGYSTAQISRLEQSQRLPNPSTLKALVVPALELEEEPELAARLLALAHEAHDQRTERAYTSEPAVAAPPIEQHEPAEAIPASRQLPGANVLVTKLLVPRLRPERVSRPRLFDHLDVALSTPLTLVSAPAGCGKTTLLADWLSARVSDTRRHVHGAWLALDVGDNDPVIFLRHLIAALQGIAPAFGGSAIGLLQAAQPPTPVTLLQILINDLAGLPPESVLVLDDYHLITTPTIHEALAWLLEHLPPALHLVLATRVDPPLPLARLRGRGQLGELRTGDLRFTPDETATFLTEVMRLPLSGADIAALETRTEGWIAGLQLAALAMRDRSDCASFIDAFTGSHRFVVDYLAEEVFARQPSHLQLFLLQTAILDRLCGSLCDAVMGLEDHAPDPRAAYTQTLLEELERANLFIVPLDGERRWYRYHHLFAEVLRTRLVSGATTTEIATLHGRANTWYEQRGMVAEAIHHALAGHAWQNAARLIEEHSLPLMMSGQIHTGLGWLSALPSATLQWRPLICILHAIGLMLIAEYEPAEARLQDAERSLPPEPSEELARVVQGSVTGLRGRIRYFAGDLAGALGSLRQALTLLPQITTSVATGRISAMARAAWTVYVAMDYQLTGDVTAASERRVADAIAPVRELGHLMAALNGYTALASLQVLQGRLRAAATTYAEVEQLAPGQDLLHSLVGSPSYFIGMGDLLRERNNLDDAERYLARGMELLRGTLATEGEVVMQGYLTLARVQQAQDKSAAALATLDAFMELARERRLSHLLSERAAAMQARLRLS